MKRSLLILVSCALLAGCGAPPDTAFPVSKDQVPAAAPTSPPRPTVPPTPPATPTPNQAPVATQTVVAQQLAESQQTAAASQRTSVAQQAQLQTLTGNQTVTAQQIAAVQQNAISAQQTAAAATNALSALQTVVANLVGVRQTAVATQAVPTATFTPVPPTSTPTTLYPWYWKRPIEQPQMCGPGFGDPCADTAPNAGTQYVSGYVMDSHKAPVAGITINVKVDQKTVLFNSTDTTGYYSVPFSTTCPKGPLTLDVYIVDVNQSLSSYVKTFTYTDCHQAGEFHLDFVQVAK